MIKIQLLNEFVSLTFVVTFIPGNDSFEFEGFLACFDDIFFLTDTCVSLVPLAVLLYCYIMYCPGQFNETGILSYIICSYELDRVCDLVNVIMLLN